MFFKSLIINIFLFLFIALNLQAYSQQKIKGFYLSNLKDNGFRDWEVRGREAILHDEYVDIDEMNANYYLKDDTINITSDEARLNKESMDLYLKDNVNIKNKEGATLITDSLDWQRQKNQINTEDWVKVERNSMQIIAKGLSADTQLKNADFKEDVEVVFPDEKTGETTTITCKGPLEIEYNLGKAVFNQDVVVKNKDGTLNSDKTTLFFDNQEKRIKTIIAEGNVKITRDDNVTFSQKATYTVAEQKIVLEGRPRLYYFPKENEDIFPNASEQ